MTTNIPLAVYWAEGMMLCPQHFQQFSHRIEKLTALQLGLARPFFWGVIEFEYDKDSLVTGELIVEKLTAIMPDGLFYQYERKTGEESLNLKFADLVGNQNRLTLSFIVNEVVSEHKDSRFTITNVDPVADIFNPDVKMAYQALKVNGMLAISEEIKPGFVELPLLEVELVSGVWKETDYIPPTIVVKRNNKAGARINAILEQISVKLATLESKLTSPESAELVDTYRLKYIISNIYGDLAILAADAKNDASHPYDIYLVLCSVWGKLSGFSEIKGFDEYVHTDVNKAYDQLGNKVIQTINHLIPLCLTVIVNIDDHFEFSIGKSYLKPNTPVVFGINKSNFDTIDVFQKWLKNLIIAPRSEMARIQQTRTQGISRQLVKGHYSDEILATENIYLIELGAEDMNKITGQDDIVIHDNTAGRGQVLVRTIYLYRLEEEVE